jgi:dihydropteroate synthase
MLAIAQRKRFTIRARGYTLDLGPRTLVMGILNVTPDSFFDGGQNLQTSQAVARAWRLAEEGADILDIGGESTRPGSEGVSAEAELERVLPVLDGLGPAYPLPISIDTRKSEVARAALERGAAILNDVTALTSDPAVGSEAASSGAALILMHMRGTPSTMQRIPSSPDILGDLDRWAEDAVARAEKQGVSSEKIILDPGIGFGKSASQNLQILRNLPRLAAAGFPLLVGPSRKSFLGAVLEDRNRDRAWGTSAAVAASVVFGAHIVRVHDVAAMRDVVRVTDAILMERATD